MIKSHIGTVVVVYHPRLKSESGIDLYFGDIAVRESLAGKNCKYTSVLYFHIYIYIYIKLKPMPPLCATK